MRSIDNTVLVTGGGSGIGRGLATAFYKMGNRVVVAGRRMEALQAVADAHPGMDFLHLDQADPHGVVTFANEITDRHPDLNVLVNNAGVTGLEDLRSPSDLDAMRAMVATNLTGPIALTSLLLPILMTRPHAAIINVTSALAFVPMASRPTYSATKAALHSYSQSLRFQLRGSGVEVLELLPPQVKTETHPGSAGDVHGLELESFISEAMQLLKATPTSGEIVVEAARAVRHAERDGAYAEVFAAINASTEQAAR